MRAVALLSGGLDSVVSVILSQQELRVVLALTVDYGQRAARQEIKAAQAVAAGLNIPHQVIQLPFMTQLQSDLMRSDAEEIINPWVPNRNGLFLNLAACFAENMEAQTVVCGFNREEAANFPDNSAAYIQAVNQSLFYSTRNHVSVKSYVQDMTKEAIVKQALRLGIDISSLWSCYQDGDQPCGQCPSCVTNQNAFRKVGYNAQNHGHR